MSKKVTEMSVAQLKKHIIVANLAKASSAFLNMLRDEKVENDRNNEIAYMCTVSCRSYWRANFA